MRLFVDRYRFRSKIVFAMSGDYNKSIKLKFTGKGNAYEQENASVHSAHSCMFLICGIGIYVTVLQADFFIRRCDS